MIRKRLLSACLALALCLGLLPVTALAAEEIKLFIGGQQITESGCYEKNQDGDWTKVEDSDGTEPANGQFYYDAATFTLTLNQAKITHDQTVTVAEGYTYEGSVIAFSQTADVSLKIVVSQGRSTITGTGGVRVESTTGDVSLSIAGPGSLDVEPKGSNSGITLCSSKNTNLDIDGADVTASSPAQYGVYLISSTDASSTSTITVNNGSLTTSGNGNVGIYYYWSGTNNAGTSSLTVSGNAVVDTRNSQIMAQNKETVVQVGAGSDGNGGIVFNGTEGTVYGEVELQNDLEIKSGETLTIPDDSSLNSNGKLTNNGKIIVDNGGKLEGTINGNQPPKITTERLNDGTVNTKYNQTLVASGDATITWSSSDLPNLLTLNSDGTISGTPTAAGTYSFTVTATNDYGSDSKEFTLTIDQQGTIHVTSVSLDKTSLELTEGGTGTLIATVEPSNATNKNVTWESSNTSVATVNNGEVTAVSAGTATITATTVDQSKTATCEVTVKPAEYTVTVLTDGKGSASASPATAEAGTTVILTADPDNGWRFSRWEVVEGDVTISGNSFTMPAENVTVRAVFSPIVNLPDTYDIDLIVGEGGKARLSLTNASEGSTITVTATPDAGYELDYITVDGERISGTTFTMPNHDVTVRVYFTDGAALPFTDVSAGAWYFDAVGYVYVGGLMDGVSDTLFDPDGTMTRAMVWAILARVDGETVTGDGWIETARDWAVAEGVSDGENATDYVTREQFATMLWRYAGEPETDGSGVGVFDDGETVSIWAFDAMSWALNNGVITGVSDDALLPANTATRAQCAAMLMRFVEAIG